MRRYDFALCADTEKGGKNCVKKLIAILASAALCLTLCACAGLESLRNIELPPLPEVTRTPQEQPVASPEPAEQTDREAEPTQTVDSVTEPPAEPETLENRVLVRFEKTAYEQYDPAEGKELILSFSYVTPKLRIEGRDEAAGRINQVIAMLDDTYYTGNDYGEGPASGFLGMLEAAEDNYAYIVGTGETGLSMVFSSERTARIARVDRKLINIIFSTYEYSGGAHGMYGDKAYVFDAESGERLSLDDLSADPGQMRTGLVSAMIAATEGSEYYEYRIPADFVAKEDYPTAFAALLREGSWYFSDEGLVIFSDLYELGPYATGITEFTVPYEKLAGLIDERWFPAQRDGCGELSVQPLSELEDGTVELIDKITVSEGEDLVLRCSGTVYDLCIASTEYYADRFHESAQLWCASFMDDCALQLVASIPEGLPELMVRYSTAEGQFTKLLSYSREDGGWLLIDEEDFDVPT